MTKIPLCDWQFIGSLCPEVSQVPLLNKVQEYKGQGINIEQEYNSLIRFTSRFVAVFDNESDAVLFKLAMS